MKQILIRIAFFILILFILLELFFSLVPFIEAKYDKRINLYTNLYKVGGTKYCFIGSSRVAAAVQPDTISMKNSVFCINAGKGYSTAAIHYLGLKYALKKNKDCLKNTKVFVESPMGFCSFYDNWNSPWVNEESPNLIIPYLDASSYKDFWRIAGDKFKIKLWVSTNYFIRSVRLFNFSKEMIVQNSLKDILIKTNVVKSMQTPSATLTNRGGIKTDSSSVVKAREMAVEYYDNYSKNQNFLTIKDWEQSIFMDMVKLVNDAGGKLIMFEIPLSSVQRQAYETKAAIRNIQEFSDFRKKYQIDYIKVPFRTTDRDFPDLWHISNEKASEYSNVLAAEIDSLKLIAKLDTQLIKN
jgi:hypothetical protein